MIRQYLKDYKKAEGKTTVCRSIEAVSSMGTEFQKYVLGQKTEANFCRGTELHRPVLQKSIVLMLFCCKKK